MTGRIANQSTHNKYRRTFALEGGETMKNVKPVTDWMIDQLKRSQTADGSWAYPFETGITTDAYTIILLRSLEMRGEEPLISGLVKRILSRQEENGAWKVFHDEHEGNLTTTVEAYYALLYSGRCHEGDPRLEKARNFIVAKGGLAEVNIFAKIMLAMTGQMNYPSFFPLPIEAILLPITSPVNFYSISMFGRANMTPFMIITDKKYTLKTVNTPNLRGLNVNKIQEDSWRVPQDWQPSLQLLKEGFDSLAGSPEQIHQLAIDRATKYMLDHIEADGTYYSYYSSTFLMIFALLSLGYHKTDPLIKKAIAGIKSMVCDMNGLPHMQFTTANVWNTSLIGYALQTAGIAPDDTMLIRANEYLLGKQHHKFGDWIIHNRSQLPGGWGFSNVNTINPDVDDTIATLRVLASMPRQNHEVWNKGVSWLLSMQNDDGGWAAFEKNTNAPYLELLPIEKGKFILSDPSCADITGRTLEFLGNHTTIDHQDESVRKAVAWLMRNQQPDGSWYGRWGICYIYGTWAAVTGLLAIGVPRKNTAVNQAIKWLEKVQNEDGGWGESCMSDQREEYIPLGESTLTQTAWALDALIAAADHPTTTIDKGISYLVQAVQREDWSSSYPTGQGIAGFYYIHYHSYRHIFPLIALSHYHTKFGS